MSASSSPPTSQMQQTINFPGGGSLGISVDDVLNVRRVNDPDSAAIKAARYGVIHWRVVAVAGAAVASKADLVRELKARRPRGERNKSSFYKIFGADTRRGGSRHRRGARRG